MWRVPAASTLSWHSKRLRVVAMAGGARHIRAGGWRPASGWTRKPAYRRVVQLAARWSLEPYVAGSSPAPPANHSRMWARSPRTLCRGGVAGLVPAAAGSWMAVWPGFANTKTEAYGQTLADGLIAVRQGRSSNGRALADAGSSPAVPRLGGPWCRSVRREGRRTGSSRTPRRMQAGGTTVGNNSGHTHGRDGVGGGHRV